ncbi:hypothetical protein [Paenibacillus albiflavus]|uniref:hypothetical protein n=1 Tax=Paenibacillus albiflavus TaxID=2545760 RepID=UPI0014048AFB|nr:hypothetical protein [Paenibacillus albiflavus]
MNPRMAMKEMIKFMLEQLDVGNAESVAEQMHDDPTFLEELEQFFQDHIEDFGENYGL